MHMLNGPCAAQGDPSGLGVAIKAKSVPVGTSSVRIGSSLFE